MTKIRISHFQLIFLWLEYEIQLGFWYFSTSFAFLKIIHPTAAGYPSSVAVQLFRRTWGARWQLFSARAIYQADVLTQPRHNKSSHVIPATSTKLAEFYFSETKREKMSTWPKLNDAKNSATFFSTFCICFRVSVMWAKGQKWRLKSV